MKKNITMLGLLILVGALLVACTTQAKPILKVTGTVKTTLDLTLNDLKGMAQTKADYTDKNGNKTTYLGVLINSLLEKAGIADGANITMLGGDGYSSPQIGSVDIKACNNCIVALLDDGKLQSVLPGQAGKLQVKDLVEIQVK
jgi:hypothetical protein